MAHVFNLFLHLKILDIIHLFSLLLVNISVAADAFYI